MTHKINDKVNFKDTIEGKGTIIAIEKPRGFGQDTYIVAESEEESTYKWHPTATFNPNYNRMIVRLKAYQIF
jgi:hypothetical protein